MTPIEQYVWKYPQLSLPVREGMSKTPEYLSMVRKGILPEHPVFSLPETGLEEAQKIHTPAGVAEVLYLPDRKIFEYFVRVLGYRCEPVELPASMGAMMISGINSWRRIEAHKKEYLDAGGRDWKTEFREFTSTPENYKDYVLLISRGNYSALSAEDAGFQEAGGQKTEAQEAGGQKAGFQEAGFQEAQWLEKSRIIRTYHELSHFVSRRLFPQNRQTLRDEIVADSIGMVAAFGFFDETLARKVLGIEGETYRAGGRLENYVDENRLSQAITDAGKIILELKNYYQGDNGEDPFKLLLEIEQKKIGMETHNII